MVSSAYGKEKEESPWFGTWGAMKGIQMWERHSIQTFCALYCLGRYVRNLSHDIFKQFSITQLTDLCD
jgi:hypothetical protein